MSANVKLRLYGWWTDSSHLNDRIIKQFIPRQEKSSIDFVTDDSYDFMIVFGKLKSEIQIKDKSKIIFFSQEPLWSPNESRNPSSFAYKSFVSDNRVYENPNELTETLLPMFYAGHNETHHDERFDWSYDLRFTDLSNQKNKGVSYIVRKDYCSYWDSYVNRDVSKLIYKMRTDLGRHLSEQVKDVIIGGINWENNDINILGNIWNKRVLLNNFRLSICVENTIQRNYISEKFWDVVLTDTIPIYIGCSNINDYIPSDYFINMTTKVDDMDGIIDEIKEISNNSEEVYRKYKPKIKELKELFFTDKRFNLWLKIKEVISS